MASDRVTLEQRAAAFAEVGGICVACGAAPCTELHHNPPRGAAAREHVDLVPLCGLCHLRAHQSTRTSVPELRLKLLEAREIWSGRPA